MTGRRLIRWFDFSKPITEQGYSLKEELEKAIKEFEKAANKKLKEEQCQHVLYAIKYYSAENKVMEVRFYLNPLTDEELEEADRTKNGHKFGHRMYVLHNRTRSENNGKGTT